MWACHVDVVSCSSTDVSHVQSLQPCGVRIGVESDLGYTILSYVQGDRTWIGNSPLTALAVGGLVVLMAVMLAR